MSNIGYNNRWIRMIKDLVFAAIGCWLIWRGGIFAVLLGVLALAWYGRDAYYQAKVLWQEKHYVPKNETPRPGPAPSAQAEDGKITVTNLNDAKEVEFEKE